MYPLIDLPTDDPPIAPHFAMGFQPISISDIPNHMDEKILKQE